METKAHLRTIATLSEYEIGLGESAVVQVEAGWATGYVIAESFRPGQLPCQIMLNRVIYLLSDGDTVTIADLPEVLVSGNGSWWSAMDPTTISLIPCPSRQPYPILFVSVHGFRWMRRMVLDAEFGKLLRHLQARFTDLDFCTDRTILTAADSPFANLPLVPPVVRKLKHG